MIIKIECDSAQDINSLYSAMADKGAPLTYRLSVIDNIMDIHMHDKNISDQKIIINRIKQFMRDNEINYTMELR